MSESEAEKRQRLAALQERAAQAYRARDQLTNRYEDGICIELFDAADQERLRQLAESVTRTLEKLLVESETLFRELSGKVEIEK